MKKDLLGHYWHVFLFSCRHGTCTTVMTLREVTPDQAHQAVKGQNYKGGEWWKVRPWSEGAPLILASRWSVGVRQGYPSLPVAFLLLIVCGQWLVPSQGCTLPFFQQLLLLLPSLNEISTPIPRRLKMFFRLLVIASCLLFLASALPFNQVGKKVRNWTTSSLRGKFT